MIALFDRMVEWLSPRRRPGTVVSLLLLPAGVLMVVVFVYSLLLFARFSFYQFEGGKLTEAFQFGAYAKFFLDSFYWTIIGKTFWLAARVTVWTLWLAYPLAYYSARIHNSTWRELVLLITFAPLLVSAVVRSYGWMILLSNQGLVNWLLLRLGLIEKPLALTFNEFGVVVALVHIFLPFMVFPILSVLVQTDSTLKQAANDLGADRWRAFFTITLPLSVRGIASGVQIVFTLCLTAFVTPALIGGGRVMVLPTLIYQRTIDINWPIAAVAGIFLIAASTLTVYMINWVVDRFAFQR